MELASKIIATVYSLFASTGGLLVSALREAVLFTEPTADRHRSRVLDAMLPVVAEKGSHEQR
ncbi:MAG TPA: hypothetical protein DEP84_32985 [Chloroflexi bacterium]|nr:hypothetical protein [Chloroflexota bacterium]